MTYLVSPAAFIKPMLHCEQHCCRTASWEAIVNICWHNGVIWRKFDMD